MSVEVVEVTQWPKPQGYANGMRGQGAAVHIAGQIGWNADGKFEVHTLLEQFAVALDNVLAVVAAAGGAPTDIARMTVYVTDIEAYRNAGRALGEIWRPRLGRHFPAMALVAVTALVEREAMVEIEATAYVG
ncbi:MAG TPA: RidA family protein [Kofleriaceae bacterium]|nr:RidA family protein [Kofleriaceae bacterium]